MKILLVGNHQQDSVNSVSMKIFANLLYSGLTASGHEVLLVRPKSRLYKLTGCRKGFGKWSKYIDQYIFFPFELRRLEKWADVVHICDHSNAPLLSYLSGKPCLVTCHDVIGIKRALGLYSEERAGWTGRILQAWTARNLKRANRIACVSQTVKRELGELLHMDENKLGVVYNGLNYTYAPMDEVAIEKTLRPLSIPLAHSFILHVGSDEWKKNRGGVVEIFVELRKMNHPSAGYLVFVGAPLSQEMNRYLEEQGLAGVVRSFNHVPSEVLCALYSKASLFLFPSLYEGFGWPIIEAQACGCLVATSNRDPMLEISGQGAIHIDPEDSMGSAQIIARMSQAEQDSIRQRGLENAKQFSSRTMLEIYEFLYKILVASSKDSAVAASV